MIHDKEKYWKGVGSPHLINYPKEGLHPLFFPLGEFKTSNFRMKTLWLGCTHNDSELSEKTWSGKAKRPVFENKASSNSLP
jgi:hypothetical protein